MSCALTERSSFVHIFILGVPPSARWHHWLTRAPTSSLSSSVVGVMVAGREILGLLSPRGQTLQMSCLPRNQTKGIFKLGLEISTQSGKVLGSGCLSWLWRADTPELW